MRLGSISFVKAKLSPESDLVRSIEAARVAGELWASSWTHSSLLSEAQSAQVILARKDQEEVGFVFLRAPGALWEITLIYIAPESRGTGVFEGLIEASKRIALVPVELQRDDLKSQSSTSQLGLEVRADNLRALKAYERVGFQEVSRRKAYYRDGCDAILMEIDL